MLLVSTTIERGRKMKLWVKILIVCVGGAVSWGLAYTASLMPTWAVVFASLSTASTVTVSILTGWTPKAG